MGIIYSCSTAPISIGRAAIKEVSDQRERGWRGVEGVLTEGEREREGESACVRVRVHGPCLNRIHDMCVCLFVCTQLIYSKCGDAVFSVNK